MNVLKLNNLFKGVDLLFEKYLILATILVIVSSVLTGCSTQSSATNEKKGDMAAMNDKDMATMKDKVEANANTTQSTNKEQVFEGWLMDKMSSDAKDPEKKTKECLLMPMMEESGYGVLVKQQDNTFKYYKFDAAGHKLAKETILNKTNKIKNIKITVKGVIEGELMKVSSIQEIS